MSNDSSMEVKINELSSAVVVYQDLYRQAADGRDYWRKQTQMTSQARDVLKNKLRDEADLCDQLAEFVNAVITKYPHLPSEDVKWAKLLSKLHEEARDVYTQ